MSYPVAIAVSSVQAALNDSQWDALVIVAASFTAVTELQSEINAAAAIDSRIGKETVLLLSGKAPGQRLVLSPTGQITTMSAVFMMRPGWVSVRPKPLALNLRLCM